MEELTGYNLPEGDYWVKKYYRMRRKPR